MNKIQAEGYRLLKHRVERMRQFLDGLHPDGHPNEGWCVILANEARMIADAGKMISPDAFYTTDRARWLEEAKRMMSLCQADGCENEIAGGIASTELESELGREYCDEHAVEAAIEHAEVDRLLVEQGRKLS